jgi:hypothetical protein
MLVYVNLSSGNGSAHVHLSSGNGSAHVRERKEGRQAGNGAAPTSLKLDQFACAYLVQEDGHLLFGLEMLLGEGGELDLERSLSVCLRADDNLLHLVPCLLHSAVTLRDILGRWEGSLPRSSMRPPATSTEPGRGQRPAT